MAVGEILAPEWAEARRPLQWHPRHIGERHGLFFFLLLREAIVVLLLGLRLALDTGSLEDATAVVLGLALLPSLWWCYFLHQPGDDFGTQRLRNRVWVDGHIVFFGAVGNLVVALELHRRVLGG